MKLDVIKKFADALSNHNLDQISTLLHGELEVFETVNNLKVDKKKYMEWLQHELTTTETGSKLSYKVDTCDGCTAGEPVVVFDDGRFPKQKLSALFQYSAWNLEVLEGLIIGITFCHSSKTFKEQSDFGF